MTGRLDAAAVAGRRRPARSVRPGWWVYAYGARGGGWAEVVAVGWLPRGWVRFELRAPDGARTFTEASPDHPKTCLSAAAAARAGLRRR